MNQSQSLSANTIFGANAQKKQPDSMTISQRFNSTNRPSLNVIPPVPLEADGWDLNESVELRKVMEYSHSQLGESPKIKITPIVGWSPSESIKLEGE